MSWRRRPARSGLPAEPAMARPVPLGFAGALGGRAPGILLLAPVIPVGLGGAPVGLDVPVRLAGDAQAVVPAHSLVGEGAGEAVGVVRRWVWHFGWVHQDAINAQVGAVIDEEVGTAEARGQGRQVGRGLVEAHANGVLPVL